MERLPNHIHQLVSDLEAGCNVETLLQAASPLARSDSSLLHLLVQFGYDFDSNSFTEPPCPAEVLRLVREEYGSPLLRSRFESPVKSQSDLHSNEELRKSFIRTVYENHIDQIATCSELGLEEIEEGWSLAPFWEKPETFSPHRSDKVSLAINELSPSTEATLHYNDCESDNDANRSTRGLRHLTSLVKDVVSMNRSTSYKEVAVKLIKKLIIAKGHDRIREEKNVRRRVYDAINVLIAAGVLEKHGKCVTLREDRDSMEFEETREQYEDKLASVRQKQAELQELLRKYVSIKHLLQRNCLNPTKSPRISFPFIIVSTNDNDCNSVLPT
jgi:hypothetical protein